MLVEKITDLLEPVVISLYVLNPGRTGLNQDWVDVSSVSALLDENCTGVGC